MKIIELNSELLFETHIPINDDSTEFHSNVNKLWSRSINNSSKNLFDGPIYSVRAITPHKLHVEKTSYKFFYAQLCGISSNFDRIRPLAVTGVFTIDDGYLLGLRNSSKTTQSGGKWELVPSGSVEHTVSAEISFDEVFRQINIEAQEELGISESDIHVEFANFALDNEDTGVIDLVFFLNTDKSMEWISKKFSSSRNSEYTELKWIPKSYVHLIPWLKENASSLVEESSVILHFLAS